jgi:hypothetical protein
MAVATYTTDLVNINLVETAGGIRNWTAVGGGSSGLVSENDFYIQGNACISKAGWSTSTRGMIFLNGAGVTVAAGNAIFMWVYMWAPNALAIESAGGLQIIIGSSTKAYRHWYVRGSDTYQYGGWICVPIDPTTTPNATTGTPTATRQSFGALANITGSVTKGQPLGIDAFRHGRTIIILSGEAGNYGNFDSASTTNDTLANRWGLFQNLGGSYLHQGLFQMGSSVTAVDFRDSNRTIAIVNTKQVSSRFNGYEVRNVASNVEWNNISISSLGTISKGYFEDVDNATIVFNECSFTDMSTFTFKSNNTINDTTFRRTDLIIQNGALIDGCLLDTITGTASIRSTNPTNIRNCEFISDGTNHAIEIVTAGIYSFVGNTYINYAVSDGTSGNEVIYNNSGGLVTLNLSGGDFPSVRNGAGAATSIVDHITIKVTGLKDNTEVRVYLTNTITELAGIETATDGTTDNRSFSFSLTAGTTVDIVIISITYENERINGYVIPASNSSIPVQQRIDRNYLNL